VVSPESARTIGGASNNLPEVDRHELRKAQRVHVESGSGYSAWPGRTAA
jgi:hypothetical protein